MIIGVFGGGQLGRMLALAGIPLAQRFIFLDPDPDAPAAQCGQHIRAPYDDADAIEALAQRADVMTTEFENIPESALMRAASLRPFYPGVRPVQLAQDRIHEKEFFRSLAAPVHDFYAVSSREELDSAAEQLGFPFVLKTRRFGYDGKGQLVVRHQTALESAWGSLGSVPLIAERFVAFRRELSIIGVRGASGEIGIYPIQENEHYKGILHVTRIAADVPPAMLADARELITTLLESLNYVGVLTIELFDTGDRFYINEMAPRVHNSGHWSIEGAHTSQFENHVRAVAGLPLGSCDAARPAAMINVIGTDARARALTPRPGRCVHLYDKAPRAGRKVGHVTVYASDAHALTAILDDTLRELGHLLDE